MDLRSFLFACSCAVVILQACGESGPTCGDGTREVGGECVPADTACEPGTVLDAATGTCVPDFASVCGPGTEPAGDGTCTPVISDCGPGTTLEDGECVPLCTGDQVFDEVAEACVDQCAPGTVYNPATGTCQPRCVDEDYYVASLDACVHVPECLRNTMLGDTSGDCEGWPFSELSLETVCARRAFYVCDSTFDCGCGHAGESFAGRIIIGDDPRLLDYDSCLAEHYFACDQHFVSYPASLVQAGMLSVSPQGLADVDAYFAVDEGVCTRPVGWRMWPEDIFAGMFEPAVARGDECDSDAVCSGDDYCAEDETYQPMPLDPPERFTCQARATAGELCDDKPCAAPLICMPEVGGTGELRCHGPRNTDQLCRVHSDCADGLYCYPADLPDFLAGNDSELAVPTCQPPIIAGDECPGAAWQRYQDIVNAGFRYNDNEPHSFDLCGPTRVCRGALPSNGFVGLCEAATGIGEACDWCGERVFAWNYEYRDDPVWQFLWVEDDPGDDWVSPAEHVPFGECGGGLTCVYDASEVVARGRCADAVSVCPYTWAEIYDIDAGGVCTEVCDDGIDNDFDGWDVDGDGTYEYEFIDCGDFDCVLDANCFEYVCDDGLDDDGDSPGGTENIDCEDFDCCYAVSDACITEDTGNPGNNIGSGVCNEAGRDGDNCLNFGFDLLDSEAYGPIDDDGDGLYNCDDPDCAGVGGCP